MILVDTSVWIELLKWGPVRRVPEEELSNLATCGAVVQEVLQGLRDDPAADAFRESLLALPLLGDPLPLTTFLAGAGIYHLGRAKGYTIRSSVDCLIAATERSLRMASGPRLRDHQPVHKSAHPALA